MKLYRIINKRQLANAFSGIGAKTFGGRWNHSGDPSSIIYTSESPALAAMELFVNVQRPDKYRPFQAIKLLLLEIKVPKNIKYEKLDTDEIPEAWREVPASDETKNIGTDWARSCKTLLLKVPAVVVPSGYNYLINPLHKDFNKLKILKQTEFTFDRRLWREKQ